MELKWSRRLHPFMDKYMTCILMAMLDSIMEQHDIAPASDEISFPRGETMEY